MTVREWMALAGAVLLVMALTSAWIQRLPVSTAIIYLVLGVAIGPVGAGIVRIDLVETARWLEPITEVAVLVSLFVGGLKMRVSPRDPRWFPALILAGPVMLVSIAGVTVLACAALGLDLAHGLLLGAMLAPTDPVLAGAVTVNDAQDRDRVRYGLSGEAGLNDGAAFPFVVLALGWAEHGGAGMWLGKWALLELVWAVPAGLMIGYLLGLGVGRLAVELRTRGRDALAPNDFLALALIALTYVIAEAVGSWGFLAVFAAGVGLRRFEVKLVARSPHPEHKSGVHPPAEAMVPAMVEGRELASPAVATGMLVAESLSFGHTVEKLLEVLLVALVGVALAVHWDPRGVLVALALFIVIRPLGALLLIATRTTWRQRALMAWLGIRGIGSIYYLTYAMGHGLAGAAARELSGLVVSVIATSVVLHGISATPLLTMYKMSFRRRVRLRRRAPS